MPKFSLKSYNLDLLLTSDISVESLTKIETDTIIITEDAKNVLFINKIGDDGDSSRIKTKLTIIAGALSLWPKNWLIEDYRERKIPDDILVLQPLKNGLIHHLKKEKIPLPILSQDSLWKLSLLINRVRLVESVVAEEAFFQPKKLTDLMLFNILNVVGPRIDIFLEKVEKGNIHGIYFIRLIEILSDLKKLAALQKAEDVSRISELSISKKIGSFGRGSEDLDELDNLIAIREPLSHLFCLSAQQYAKEGLFSRKNQTDNGFERIKHPFVPFIKISPSQIEAVNSLIIKIFPRLILCLQNWAQKDPQEKIGKIKIPPLSQSPHLFLTSVPVSPRSPRSPRVISESKVVSPSPTDEHC